MWKQEHGDGNDELDQRVNNATLNLALQNAEKDARAAAEKTTGFDYL